MGRRVEGEGVLLDADPQTRQAKMSSLLGQATVNPTTGVAVVGIETGSFWKILQVSRLFMGKTEENI